MRISVELEKIDAPILLPVNYNYLILSMIYRNITPSLSEFLHSEGYAYEKRRFKLFTFSRLKGKYIPSNINGKKYLLFPF